MKIYALIIISSICALWVVALMIKDFLSIFHKEKENDIINKKEKSTNGIYLILKTTAIFIAMAILIIAILYNQALSREPNNTGNIYSQYKQQMQEQEQEDDNSTVEIIYIYGSKQK